MGSRNLAVKDYLLCLSIMAMNLMLFITSSLTWISIKKTNMEFILHTLGNLFHSFHVSIMQSQCPNMGRCPSFVDSDMYMCFCACFCCTQEAGKINRSLSALGNVIMALGDQAHGKSRFVPYRDSKLSFLLRVIT